MLKILIVNVIFLNAILMASAQAASKRLKMPVVLPPFEVEDGITSDGVKPEWGSCLFYMETLGIAVYYDVEKHPDKHPSAWPAVIQALNSKHTFGWSDTYVNCIAEFTKKTDSKSIPQIFTFVVDITTGEDVKSEYNKDTLFSIKSGSNFKLTLNFTTLPDYGWGLADIKTEAFTIQNSGSWLNSDLKVDAGNAVPGTVAAMQIGGFFNYTYGCSNTTSAYFNTSQPNVYVGVFFGNVQIQSTGYQLSTDGKKQVHFLPNTNDCVGTFTAGSLMGILVTLLFASSLIFAVVMLNSVKTLDRLDDPRQKQIFVNAKD